MKTRVLVAMLIIFILVAGVCITCGTVFVVREVEIKDVTVQSANPLTEEEKAELISKCGLQGKNILFNLNQNKINQNVKEVNAKFKLHSVTAKFPNHVTLVISRRVPVYYDANYMYDAEMCIVGSGTTENLIDITNVNLQLNDGLKAGDLAVGVDELSQHKLEQLKAVANYFDSLKGFGISYDDRASEVGDNQTCLLLKIKSDVTFKIKVAFDENFLHALDYTRHIYTYTHRASGEYYTLYQDNHQDCVTTLDGVYVELPEGEN